MDEFHPSIRVREVTPFSDGLSPAFSTQTGLLLQRIYRARDINDTQQLALGLAGLPAPGLLYGIGAAVELLITALRRDQSILIVGDFDADGATSTALAVLALRALGCGRVDFLVPNRFAYGYGLTPEIVALATQRKPDLIITVDNGISSVAGVAAAQEVGIRVLITDHHLPGREIPAAAAIVNPNQPECTFPSKNLAGVGVIFYVLSALRAALRAQNWFAERGIDEPNMAVWLDLVALGTVADMVPLDQVNRILVHQGLQRIRAGQARPGICALLELAGRERERIVASDLGFAVGPRLNAAGRLEDMAIGIECLLSDDPFAARALAVQLDELNRDRRAIEATMQHEALQILAELDLSDEQLPWGLCLFDGNWHQGVVGLLASRVKERLHRPVIAFADAGNGELKGSARSISGFHIRDALDAVATRNPGLVSKFGGHAMAAGLSLPRENFAAFVHAFDDQARLQLALEDLAVELVTDGELASGEITLDCARQLRDGGPWGQHFPEPSFHGTFRVLQYKVVGAKHLKLVLTADDNNAGDSATAPTLDAIAFNVVDQHWSGHLPERVKMVYRLDVNFYRGVESLQLMIEHLLLD